MSAIDVEGAVRARYSEGAKAQEAALCCPIPYDPRLLEALPQEVLDRDYGCGDPSRYVRAGDVVLDLGSGGGKICFMAAQIAGPTGRVIGVDMTDEMLGLARRSAPVVAERLGYANVEFRRGRIQDLALDLDALDAFLAEHPVRDSRDLAAVRAKETELRRGAPMVADGAVDLVVSNCVLNLVEEGAREELVREIFRVLKPGGRIAISDIVSDEPVPDALKRDPALWSGCISGAFQEGAFLRALEDAGFVGVVLDKWDDTPWQVVEGIEFRSVTVTARKPGRARAFDGLQAVIYRGPFRQVQDDEGTLFRRGERVAVSEGTFERLTSEPYAGAFIGVQPRERPKKRAVFTRPPGSRRDPRETKGADYVATREGAGGCCGAGKTC